ncbi:MAG: nucleotidyltransferase family protein [Pseudomonadota bacterium]
MTTSPRICAALLAAGQSERFGHDDKLAQDLHGRMLGHYVAETLTRMEFTDRIAVVSSDTGECVALWSDLGLHILTNPRSRSGMGTSVALAARHAQETGADGLLICLADMPFVSESLLGQLVAAFCSGDSSEILCAINGGKRSPPALFGSRHFDALIGLTGDTGARKLIAEAEVVAANPDELVDIDTREELARWNARPLP